MQCHDFIYGSIYLHLSFLFLFFCLCEVEISNGMNKTKRKYHVLWFLFCWNFSIMSFADHRIGILMVEKGSFCFYWCFAFLAVWAKGWIRLLFAVCCCFFILIFILFIICKHIEWCAKNPNRKLVTFSMETKLLWPYVEIPDDKKELGFFDHNQINLNILFTEL